MNKENSLLEGKGHRDRSIDPTNSSKIKSSIAALNNTNIVLYDCALRSEGRQNTFGF